MALQQFGQEDVAGVLGVQVEEEERGFAADELFGGAAGPGNGSCGKIEERTLIFGGRAGRAPSVARFGDHAIEPLLEGCPIRRPCGGLEDPLFGVEDTQRRNMAMRLGERDVAEHLRVAPGLLPLGVMPGHIGFDGEGVRLRAGREQLRGGGGYVAVEIHAHAEKAGLEAGAQPVARRHADLADPAVLQRAQDTAQRQQSGHEQPGEYGLTILQCAHIAVSSP